jgi:hypothetical protein
LIRRGVKFRPKVKMPKLSKCAYCRSDFPPAELTRDHVLAGSWHPRSTPPTVQRITAPSCRACNTDRYSASERYLLLRLAACIDPKLPGAEGIWERAKRSIDVTRATDDRDRAHRQAAAESLGRDSFGVHEVPDESALPSFISNFDAGSRTAIRIRADKLNPIVEKWGLGIHFYVWKEAASADAEVTVLHVGESVTQEAFRGSEEHWKSIDCGPGIQIRYLSAREGNERESLYEFRIWETLITHVSIRETLK